eukprot:1277397-Heterocapsa_arctica.AAC.1
MQRYGKIVMILLLMSGGHVRTVLQKDLSSTRGRNCINPSHNHAEADDDDDRHRYKRRKTEVEVECEKIDDRSN